MPARPPLLRSAVVRGVRRRMLTFLAGLAFLASQ